VNPARVEAAIEAFANQDLTTAERTVAAVRVCVDTLRDFRKGVAGFREEVGDDASAEFARLVLNDLIYDLQDAITPTVRAYNALLRDLEQKLDGPGE
jgi:hypothetical protein